MLPEFSSGFEKPEVAAGWIVHVELSEDVFRTRDLYPYISAWCQRFELGEENHVLDVCCGQGETSRVIAEWCGANVTGVDISVPLIERARQLYAHRGWKFLVGDAEDLQLPKHRFDAATCINGLFHLSPEVMVHLFQELRRVVKLGRPILMISVSPDAYEEFAAFFKNPKPLEFPSLDNLNFTQTPGIVGDPVVAGPNRTEIILKDTPFIMHPPENIYLAIMMAGLRLTREPQTLGSLELIGGSPKELFIAYELIA